VAARVAERRAAEAAAAAAAAERARAERRAAEAKAIDDAKFAAIQAECGLDAAGVRAAVRDPRRRALPRALRGLRAGRRACGMPGERCRGD
jgi:membrane protein involved in colicin uptake